MQIKEISKLNQPTEQKPLTIWENSVHATHKFLNNDEILQTRSKGYGSKLLNYGIQELNIDELAVNEQNPQAVGFYEHLGFKVVERSATDDQGNPFKP